MNETTHVGRSVDPYHEHKSALRAHLDEMTAAYERLKADDETRGHGWASCMEQRDQYQTRAERAEAERDLVRERVDQVRSTLKACLGTISPAVPGIKSLMEEMMEMLDGKHPLLEQGRPSDG